MKDYLENGYNVLFIPGQQLSLEETLIWAFGRIKFKVHIVTKAAWYGIKLYVITDAVTAYVLKEKSTQQFNLLAMPLPTSKKKRRRCKLSSNW
jgi:NAD(P)H-flavin reductase